tara:strand:- start:173 stop:388 length:216 start_codon:yes stop_codon:yes gene_type:complete
MSLGVVSSAWRRAYIAAIIAEEERSRFSAFRRVERVRLCEGWERTLRTSDIVDCHSRSYWGKVDMRRRRGD